MVGVTSQLANSWAVQSVASGYSGAGGRFPAICGMPVSPIVQAIGSDGRAATGSELGSPSSRVLHELSRLEVSRQPVRQVLLLRGYGILRDAPGRGLMVAPLSAVMSDDPVEAERLARYYISHASDTPTARLAERLGGRPARSPCAAPREGVRERECRDMQISLFCDLLARCKICQIDRSTHVRLER